MSTIEILTQRLKDEGYPYIYEWKDAPGIEYPEHEHKGKVTIHILSGSITFKFPDREVALATGDHFDVPFGESHTAKVGPSGCHFLVGEMIENDS